MNLWFETEILGRNVYVQCEVTIKKNRYGDPELDIDRLRVDGTKPTEAMAELVQEVLERDYWGMILEDMPTYQDLKDLRDDERFEAYYQSDRYRRIA